MNNKEWKKSKTIYWSDELNDDFDSFGLNRPPVPKDYRYERRLPFLSSLLYYGLATPLLGTYCFFHGVKVINRGALKALKNTGYFIYANHVAVSDVFKYASYAVRGKRVNIIGYSDTLSMKFVGNIAKAIGYLPIPDDFANMKKFKKAIESLIDKKEVVLIFPEAHIWPYYTKIRQFKDGSFIYPSELNKPVVPAVTIWRGKKGRKPKQTIVFGNPIYPNPELSVMENKKSLHDECLKQMQEIVSRYHQEEYIKYIKIEK